MHRLSSERACGNGPMEGSNRMLSEGAVVRWVRPLLPTQQRSNNPPLQVPRPGRPRNDRRSHPCIHLPVPPSRAARVSTGLPAPVHMHDTVQVTPPPKEARVVLRYHDLDRAGQSVIADRSSRAHRPGRLRDTGPIEGYISWPQLMQFWVHVQYMCYPENRIYRENTGVLGLIRATGAAHHPRLGRAYMGVMRLWHPFAVAGRRPDGYRLNK